LRSAILVYVIAWFGIFLHPVWADVISIPASALLPKGNYSGSATQWSTNGITMQIPPFTAQSFLAPLILPQHARITKVIMEAHDSTGGEFGGYVRADLGRYQHNTVLVIVSTAILDTGIEAAPGDVRVVADGLNHTVDNTEFSYGFGILMNNPTAEWGKIMFYKFIVEYDVPKIVLSGPNVTP
jgi:hypothetical protein